MTLSWKPDTGSPGISMYRIRQCTMLTLGVPPVPVTRLKKVMGCRSLRTTVWSRSVAGVGPPASNR
jgi:hypothetical protein